MNFFKYLVQLLGNPKFQKTSKQVEFEFNKYPPTLSIRNSKSKNINLLIFTFLISIYAMFYIKGNNFYLAILIAIVFNSIPIYNLFIQNVKFTLTEVGINLKGRKLIKWTDVSETLIEEVDDPSTYTYKLRINLKSGVHYSISLTDLEYNWTEISHLIEYYKTMKE